MTKYTVWQKREFMFYQEVEAESQDKALAIAEEQQDWEQDQSYVKYDYITEEAN
jgi:hypothetical protein